jgi:hypothetical protein
VIKWDLIQRRKDCSILYCINRIKDKCHMTISIDAEKTFDNIQHFFIVKSLNNLDSEKTYFNKIKVI